MQAHLCLPVRLMCHPKTQKITWTTSSDCRGLQLSQGINTHWGGVGFQPQQISAGTNYTESEFQSRWVLTALGKFLLFPTQICTWRAGAVGILHFHKVSCESTGGTLPPLWSLWLQRDQDKSQCHTELQAWKSGYIKTTSGPSTKLSAPHFPILLT